MKIKPPIDPVRKIICSTAKTAYLWAEQIDKGPSEDTRTAACRSITYAYQYAEEIDKKPYDKTRRAACRNLAMALRYAEHIDKGPNDDTRNAICHSLAHYAVTYVLEYAKFVDKGPHDTTWGCVQRCTSNIHTMQYLEQVPGAMGKYGKEWILAHKNNSSDMKMFCKMAQDEFTAMHDMDDDSAVVYVITLHTQRTI